MEQSRKNNSYEIILKNNDLFFKKCHQKYIREN